MLVVAAAGGSGGVGNPRPPADADVPSGRDLFPELPLLLHVFEPRYRALVATTWNRTTSLASS